MTNKYKNKKYNKRYPKKKAKKSAFRAVAIPRATLIQKKLMIKFVYDKSYNVLPSPANSFPSIIAFRANSIKQPESSRLNGTWGMMLGAHTDDAQGFDHWLYSAGNPTGKYRQFVVLSSKISVNVSPAVNVDGLSGAFYNQVIIHKATSTGQDIAVGDSMTEIQQLPYIKQANFKSSATETQGTNASMTYSAKKMNGVTNVLDNPNFQGDYVSHPEERDYFTIALGTRVSKEPDGSASSINHVPAIVRVKIEYNVILREPNTAINEATGEGWLIQGAIPLARRMGYNYAGYFNL